IVENTEVVISINEDNRNIYTHVNMPDDEYYVEAWLADIDLSNTNHSYSSLGTLRGVYPLDYIEVTVKGSMYDDTRN
ncbi:hypothetical protein RBH29_03130, partial [Herbivorax sp. ANBcel31]|nr:hypothetical protein [Herbivorax sp. ANBcel31]